MAEHDPHALHNIDGAEKAYRSRELVSELVIGPLEEHYPEETIKALEPAFQKAVYADQARLGNLFKLALDEGTDLELEELMGMIAQTQVLLKSRVMEL